MYLEKTPLWSKPATFNRTGMLVDYNHDSDEIKTVSPNSPAEAAGLRQGDRILTINGTKPSDDPNDPLFRQAVGTVLHLQVQRGEISQGYDVTLRNSSSCTHAVFLAERRKAQRIPTTTPVVRVNNCTLPAASPPHNHHNALKTCQAPNTTKPAPPLAIPVAH